MSLSARKILNSGAWLVFAVLAVDAVLTVANLRTIAENTGRADQAREVIAGVGSTLSILKDAETGQRGFLMTGKDRYLEPYRAAAAQLDKALDRLDDLASGNPTEKSRIVDLRGLAADKMAELRETVALRREKGLEAALEVVQTDRGAGLMERVRRVVAEIQAEEERQLALRSAATGSAIRRTMTTFAVATGAALALLITVSYLKWRQDIREAQAAEAIRRSETWLSTTLTSIGDAVIATDGAGNVRFLNPIAEVLTGWTQDEAVGRPLGEVFVIVNESSRQAVESPVDRVIREGVIVGLANHTVVIARDGRETAIEDSAAPIKDPTGNVIGVVMVFQDVSERRRHQAELRESEDQFHQMAESIPQLAWIARPDGHVFWYNRRWYDYTGTTPDCVEGWGWQSLHDPDALPGVLERWKRSIASGESFDMVFPLKGVDGQFRPFLTRVMPLKDEEARVVRWFGTNTDISEERRVENLLKEAKEEAEDANRAKDDFLAVLSHELRTPLNPILLATTAMIGRPTSPEEFQPTLEMIRQNVNLQARLIDDLLDVMRIVRGKMPLEWVVSDCHDLIRRTVAITQGDALVKNHHLVLDLSAADHHVNADAARLQQVFWNLLKNAIKFTPEGGTIAVRTRNEAGAILVEVDDSGIGLEAEVLPRIFDPFHQGDARITRKFGGLGLGLAICRGIVEAHGGTIDAWSDGKDLGTRFRVALKMVPVPDDPVADDGIGGDGSAPALALNRLIILAVDDEPTTLRLLAKLLGGLGHQVVTAGTVADAWEAFQRADNFDLIISDIGLPDGTGLDLMRKVKSEHLVPAIALTGYGMDEDIRRSRQAGFTTHMTKPIDFTKLEAIIRQVATPWRQV